MIYSEEYKEHIEYTFAAFCKVVLHNAAMTAYRDFGRKQKREVSLEYLISERRSKRSQRILILSSTTNRTFLSWKGKKLLSQASD